MRRNPSAFLSGLLGGATGGAVLFLLLKFSGLTPLQAQNRPAPAGEPAAERRAEQPADRGPSQPANAAPNRGGSDAQAPAPSAPPARDAVADASAAAAPSAPPRLDLSQLPPQAALVDDTVVPSPSEVFAVLDKADFGAWQRLMPPKGARMAPSGSQEHIALLLGVVIADGFIAAEAQDAEALQQIGRNVLELSGALGVGKVAKARSNAIIEAANRKDWRSVRQELDKAQHEVQAGMAELNNAAVAQLVSLGGWLRGADALASVAAEDKIGHTRELLHQPLLAQHFLSRLADLPKRMQNSEVASLQQALRDIQPLMEKEPGPSAADVQALQQITSRLVEGVRGGTL